MFVGNVQETFKNGDTVVTEKLYGFEFVPDDAMVTDGSLAVGYDCHAPPEPMVINILLTTCLSNVWMENKKLSHEVKVNDYVMLL